MNHKIHCVILDVGFSEDKKNIQGKNRFMLNENVNKNGSSTKFGEKIIDSYHNKYSTILIENGYYDSLADLSEKFISKKYRLNFPTKGALASAAYGVSATIEDDLPLLICPGDSLIPTKSVNDFVESMMKKKAVAGTIVFKSNNPNYSFIRINKSGDIMEVAEKKAISNLATAGLYYFKSKKDFLDASLWSFVNTYNINDNYYLAPSLNYFIMTSQKIQYFEINSLEYLRFSTIVEAQNNMKSPENNGNL